MTYVDDEAQLGARILDTYTDLVQGRFWGRQANLSDVLATLMHAAHAEGLDFTDALTSAQCHYAEEVAEHGMYVSGSALRVSAH
ncbi:hypothetical protein QEZ54_08550 [Catellatospora sp. KI3]|uniref:hypothetical protein n=1 Tax=Catellatospora sp. KI3 TaxID=3041620 RepID=UPI00248319B2|nr:hypothetical protein [Catellatospora sp. KI3]MDI1461011.1 hypothetical protein [Catellatospora sp. KI3]